MTAHPEAPAGEMPPVAAGLRWDGLDILVLSPTPTAPTDQGNRKRVHAVCQELQQRGARVHFLFYPQEWWFDCLPHGLWQEMARQWHSFQLLPATRPLYAPPQGEDYQIDEWWDEAIGIHLQWLFRRQRFDAFIVNYAYLSKALDYAPAGTLKILDTHDQFTGRRQLLAGQGLAPEFFYTTAEQERIALERAQLVWAIKDEERDFYRSLSPTPCITVPHIEPPAPVARLRRAPDEGRLVVGMLGSGNMINVSNGRSFVQAALPLIAQHRAPLQIRLVGAMCAKLPDLQGLPGVDLRGPVESTDEFYQDVDLVVVPLAFSTGLKIKAVEALATGMPLVAMGHALEGIPTQHPWHRCQTLEELTEACCRIAAEPHLLDELRAASASAYAQLREQARRAFDDTARRLQQRPAVLVSVDRRFFVLDDPYREHVFQTVNLLRQLAQVTLYVDQPLEITASGLCEAFHGLAADCHLVFSEAAGPASMTRVLGVGCRVTSPARLLRELPRLSVWLTRVGPEWFEAGAALGGVPVYVRQDALRLLQPDSAQAALDMLATHCRQLTVLDSHALAPLPVAPRPGAELPDSQPLQVPFWRWRPWLLADPVGPRGVWLLAPAASAGIAALLADQVDRAHPQWLPTRIVQHGLAEDTPPDPAGRTQTLADLCAGFARMRPLPLAALDLSHDHPDFEVLREALRRAKVPVVAPAPASAWSWAALATELGARLDRLTRAAHHEESSRYAAEAGWGRVRKQISLNNVLR